jgi:EAL domain-containing protein (putative c-di-GMP-specific phosphodiesterase class I)
MNFKITNDLFGNEVGDRILADLAKILSVVEGDDCIVGRITGDRFAVLISEDKYDEKLLVEDISKLQYCINGANYKIHIAIGVYEIEDINEDPKIMCDKANIALETLKDDYGKVVAHYNTAMLNRLIYEKSVLSELDNGIANEDFKMYLQPQISRTGELVGAEAMVRWHHPKVGVIMPSDFIGIIEKRGFIFRLDNYMWEHAAKRLSIWQSKGIDNLSISVNVSTKDFYYTDLYKTFTGLVEKYNINPRLLKIEITETFFMDDTRSHIETVRKLKEYGFCIELDDFGSGYSALNMLKDIDVDIIKIDMAFLEETDNIEKSHTIIRSVINMAKALNMEVITEGVSTKEHVDFLTEAGCDIFQGFYYSMPIIVNEFEEKYL